MLQLSHERILPLHGHIRAGGFQSHLPPVRTGRWVLCGAALVLPGPRVASCSKRWLHHAVASPRALVTRESKGKSLAMSSLVQIGKVPWSREDMLGQLEEFASVYARRPIKEDWGGMHAPHMFLSWFALRALKPKAIVESGVWKGRGTWLFEQACPDARLYCIEPNLGRIQYRSKNATYFTQDFSTLDWSHLPKDETVFFFDDHQNAYERVKTCHWFGFRQHILFDDNYPSLRGDCYSLKKCFGQSGFGIQERSIGGPRLRARLKENAKRLLRFPRVPRHELIQPNDTDAKYLRQNLATYYEFPPPFKRELTRWGDRWDDEHYPTPEPLLQSVTGPAQKILWDKADTYTWMCYVTLGTSAGAPT